MQACDDIRTMIATGDQDSPLVHAHITACVACRNYATVDAKFDRDMARQFLYMPSASLSAQLIAIATDHALPAPRHARTWWASLAVIAIGVVALGFSILLSAQIVLLFSGTSAYHDYAHAVITVPDQIYGWATRLPALGTALVTFNTVRVQIIIVLVVGLLFLGYYNQRGQRQTKRTK